MRDSLVRGGGSGGTTDSGVTDQNGDDSEEKGDSSSGGIADRVRDAAGSATDTASDAVDDASDAVSGARDTVSDAADSVRDRTGSSSDSGSTGDDGNDSSAAEDAVDRIRDTASQAVDQVTDTAAEIDAGRVDAGRVGGADQITRFESEQIESDLRSNVADEFDDVGEDDVQIQQQNGSFAAQVGDQTVAEIGQDEFAEMAATGIDQVGRDDLRAEVGDGGVDIVANNDVQRQLTREAVAADDPRLEQDDVELSRDGDEFEVLLRGDSARRVEEGVSGSDLRSTAAGVGEFVGSQFESAVDSSDAIAQGLSFNFETVQRASVDPATDALGMDDTDSRPERARSQREQSRRDQLRQDVAQDSEFDEDEIAIGFDVGSGEFTASPTEDAIEQRVRQDVAEDDPNVDPEDVIVDQDGADIDVSIDRESGFTGIADVARGDQSTRDFLRAEDQRFRGGIAEPLGDAVGGDSSARTFAGSGTEEFVASFSPAGAALFADQAAQTFADVTESGPGTTVMVSLDDEQADTVESAVDAGVEELQNPTAETTGRAAGATAAVVAPLGAPRFARGVRDRTPDVDLRLNEFRTDTSAQLWQRQRRSSESQADQRTIERDSAQADPSDPSVSERVDQITERWGGEGTMTRSDRGLDESIVVEPQQRGTTQRSPEDQLPPREEFPSDAAFQRELEAVRARQADDVSTTATQDASAGAVSPDGTGTAQAGGFFSRSQTQSIAAATAAATPTEDSIAEGDVFAGADTGFDFGPAADVDSSVDIGSAFDVGAVEDLSSQVGFGQPSATATQTETASTQQSAQDTVEESLRIQQTRSPRRGRPRRPRFDEENGEELADGFDFEFGDGTFETGIADADDFFGDDNGRLF